MSKNDKTSGLNPIVMEDSLNKQLTFRSSYRFKLAQNLSNVGVQHPNGGRGTCGYISCFQGLKALGKCPKEMSLHQFTIDLFSKVNDFTVNFTEVNQTEFDLMKVKIQKVNESYLNKKFSSKSSWFTENLFYFISAIYQLDIFVYSFAQMRESRLRESCDDSCTCNVYAFFGGLVTSKAIKHIIYPTRNALCIYYRLNHYEWLKTHAGIIRSDGMQSNVTSPPEVAGQPTLPTLPEASANKKAPPLPTLPEASANEKAPPQVAPAASARVTVTSPNQVVCLPQGQFTVRKDY